MKILFINISDVIGGSAIAATRLGSGLEKYCHTDNYFVVRTKRSDKPNVFATRQNGFDQSFERWFNVFSNALGLQYQYLPVSPKIIRQKVKELKPDIISLHNTLGGYFETPMIAELSKQAPIVWTMHDMWTFTGNSAHTFGDESWKEMKNSRSNAKSFPALGINTGSFLLRQKKRIYAASNVSFVAPSKWLYNLAIQSPVLEGREVRHIFNGLDLEIFSPMDKARAREELNIPREAKTLMFSAEKLSKNIYKGGRDLIQILKLIGSMAKTEIHLLILGLGEIEEISELKNFRIHSAGYVQDEVKMRLCLSAADMLVFPTKADNLSNALVEAVSCGTPAITFDIGGCGEIIKDNISGRLIKPFDLNDFAEKTVRLLFDETRLQELSGSARAYAAENFSLKDMSRKYFELFSSHY
ncbi:MAG: glycosyltransferase [Ignavibacteria bacterium]